MNSKSIYKKFKDVSKIITGKTPSTSNADFYNGNIPFITPADLFNQTVDKTKNSITTAGANSVSIIPKNTVLISCIGSLGKTGITSRESCTNQQINSIIFNEEIVFPRYGFHFCCTLKPLLEAIAPSTTIPIINKSRFSDLEIPIPPLPEQRRIAAILDKAEALRTKRREAIAKLDQLLQSVFLEMFGDPKSNPKKFPTRYLSEFYINPNEGTKCGPFGSALKKSDLMDAGVPLWNMDNISLNGEVQLPFRAWISEDKAEKLASYIVNDGDILISRAGTVGKMCVARVGVKNSLITTNLIRLRLGEDLLPEFFVSLMIQCKGRVGRLKTGPDGTFTHMNTGVLDELAFPYPPLELQHHWLKFLKIVQIQKINLMTQSERINQCFDSISKSVFKN